MKRYRVVVFAFLIMVSLCLIQAAKNRIALSAAAAAQDHVMITPGDVKWGPAPPALPPGVQVAVLDGDPSQSGVPFTMRAKLPAGYRVPPHWHPTEENVVVLQGTLMLGLGEKFNETAGHAMPAGSYMKMPKEVRHFVWAKRPTVIQVYAVGPFEVNYVNPADDPRQKSSPK